jgi:hypothetical protein
MSTAVARAKVEYHRAIVTVPRVFLMECSRGTVPKGLVFGELPSAGRNPPVRMYVINLICHR